MKKSSLLFTLCIVLSSTGFSQIMGDHNWVLGYYDLSSDTLYSNFVFNFDQKKLTMIKKKLYYRQFGDSYSVSSSSELQFFTGGCNIRDRNGSIMKNGDTLCPGIIFRGECSASGSYYRTANSALILQSSQDSNLYYLFHYHMELRSDGSGVFPSSLKLTTIDMSKNSGLGEVIEKGRILISDTFNEGYLTACRHANGRDWWILCTAVGQNAYTILLTSKGVLGPFTQKLPSSLDLVWGGGACFSPDGSKYALMNLKYGLDLFDFDRCTGQLSNKKHVEILIPDVEKTRGGLSFSPNSRFIYYSSPQKLFQLDAEDPNLPGSVVLIDTLTLYKDPFQSSFCYQQLAPDGKIYARTSNGTRVMHVINNPDEKGKSCDFRQHYIKLPAYNASISYSPNYRLGPLKGSPCDTLSVATKELTPSDYSLKLFPNPASDRIQIDITLPHYDPSTKTEVVIVDLNGEIVQKYTMPDFAYLATLDISKLASGVYGVQLRQRNRVLAVEKLVVVK